jgi:hypothetical protein
VYYKIKRDTKDWEFEGFQDEFKKVYLGNEWLKDDKTKVE